MLKKEITYTDYNGVERKEDFYFNLSKAELAEMQMSVDGGLTTMLERIVKSQNVPEIMKLFKEIILKSYGVKSDDGKRFMKSEELSNNFEQSEAYSELFMECMSNPDKASEFITGIIPSALAQQVKAQATNV